MSLQLTDILTAARDRSPLFHKQRCPDAVLARYLTDYQRTLCSKAVHRNPSFLAQSASIFFNISSSNLVGSVGDGTVGGLPGTVDSTGTVFSVSELPVGGAIRLDTTNAVTLVSSGPVASATATTLTALSAAWATNAYAGDIVQIVAGKGQGQVRSIISNTSSQVSVAAWAIVPDTTSLFNIVTPVLKSSTDMAVAELPATSTKQAYLVRLSAQGIPYIDLTLPLVATFDVGITLPTMKRLLGGTVRFVSVSDRTETLSIITYSQRLRFKGYYGAYVMNGQIFLCGQALDWTDVESVELVYVPEPPALTSLTDYFLLPDSARPALVARTAYMAGVRVSGLPDTPEIDTSSLLAEATESESAWLAEIGAQNRSTTNRIREVW